MRKRASTVGVSLDNEETLYFMNVSIGTPAQDLRLHLDTGSSDLWTNVPGSQLCVEQGNPCSASGTYDANSSSTYEYISSDFNISYVDGSGSSGDYVSDTVRLGGVSLTAQQFGIGYTSSSQEGIMGIGYPINEVAVVSSTTEIYSNVPKHMVDDNLIATNAYSLWLNDLDASTGSILFGGVNTAKFTGTLQTIPIIPEQGVYAEFVIALTGVGFNGTQGSIASNLAVSALLDSGSSLMYLPNDITQDIYNAVGAQYDSSQGAAFVDCDLRNSAATIDFTFSTPTISVAMDELVIVAGTSRGQEICILGISPAEGSTPVLGDTFLRSAYVVYDLSRNEISLAQTNFNATDDSVVEISATSGVPDATTVTNAVTSVAAETGSARISELPQVTATGLAVPTAAVGYGALAVGVVAAFAL